MREIVVTCARDIRKLVFDGRFERLGSLLINKLDRDQLFP